MSVVCFELAKITRERYSVWNPHLMLLANSLYFTVSLCESLLLTYIFMELLGVLFLCLLLYDVQQIVEHGSLLYICGVFEFISHRYLQRNPLLSWMILCKVFIEPYLNKALRVESDHIFSDVEVSYLLETIFKAADGFAEHVERIRQIERTQFAQSHRYSFKNYIDQLGVAAQRSFGVGLKLCCVDVDQCALWIFPVVIDAEFFFDGMVGGAGNGCFFCPQSHSAMYVQIVALGSKLVGGELLPLIMLELQFFLYIFACALTHLDVILQSIRLLIVLCLQWLSQYSNLTVMLHNRHKTNYSHNHQLRSFQESPIYAPSQLDSDRSPEPFLYPASLQPKITTNKIPRFLNLKLEVTNLLSKLKQWLIELCLTQNCAAEVNEQLEPIVDQIIEIGEQQSESYWMQTLNYNRNSQHSMKQSQNIFVGSGVSENMRHCSVLMTDSRAEVALLGQNEKALVKLFFKRYYRLLENCLARINRCSGEKKLKFLVETVVKNIFSETMRVSYDLKLVQHRIKQQKEYRMSINRNGYIRLMANRIRMIFYDKGSVKQAFRILKSDYYQGLKRDVNFVNCMLKNMDRLCGIYERNKRWALTRKFYTWREASIQQKFNEQFILIDSIRTALENILSNITPYQSREQFSHNWRNTIQININLMLQNMFSGENCVFVSLQEILKQPRLERNLSIIQFLEEQEQLGGITHRSGIYKDHPFLGEFTCQELKNCILSGQIYRSERQNSSLLLIPIKPTPGIIFVALATQPISSISFSKRPLSLHSFRILLRIVEMLNPLLQQIAQKCKRIQQQWQQIDKQSHYQMFFKEFIKTELICPDGNSQNHLQVNQRGYQQFQIDSHRLEYPNSVVSSFIQKFEITNLMVYHVDEQNSINQMPCVILGDGELAKVQRHIINSIYLELINSGKEFLTITRNARSFCILPLKKEQKIIGFIHYMTKNEDKTEHVAITECLVPLVLRFEGSIDCQICNIKLALPPPQVQQKIVLSQVNRKLSYEDSLKLVMSQDLIELQQNVSALLKNQQYLFKKMIYRLDLSDSLLYYYINKQDSLILQFFNLQSSERITHNDIIIEQNTHIKDAGPLGKLVSLFPNFSNLELHLYQYQNSHAFKVIALPIKKKNIVFGYLLVGHFIRQNKSDNNLLEWLKNISESISMNNLFKSVNLQNESLSMQLNGQSLQRNALIQKMSQKISKWTGSGKLYEKIDSFTHYLSSNNQLVSFAVLKLNLKQKVMTKVTHDEQNDTPKEYQVDQDTIDLLLNAETMSSHEKLMSQTCKLTKNNPYRTIRPLKIQKLYQTNVFLAELPQQLRNVLISKIKEVFQLQGWVSTEYLSSINQIASRFSPSKGQMDGPHVLVNLGKKREGEIYYLLIVGSEPQLNQWIFMASCLLKKLKYKYSQIIAESFNAEPTVQQKRYEIVKFSKVIVEIKSSRPLIRRWKQNYFQSKYKVQKMQASIQGIVSPQKSKNKRYLSLLYEGMIKIKAQVYSVLQKNRIFCLRVVPLLHNANHRVSLKQGLDSILKSIQQPCTFNHCRSCTQLQNNLTQIATKKMKDSFKELYNYSELIKTEKQTKRKLSVLKLSQIVKFMDHRQNKRHFFKQLRKMQESFEENLSLISLQYKNMRFDSREVFLQSINQRFNTIIKQSSYSSIEKIDLFCGQKQQDLTTVYKINSENGLSERIEIITSDTLAQNAIMQAIIPCQFGENHFLLYKVATKTESSPQKQLNVIRKVIKEGVAPCYSRYLKAILQKTQLLCTILIRVNCKQMFNGSSNDAQKLYVFGRGFCPEEQCQKLLVMSKLRSIKKFQKNQQTKMLTNAINQQSKNLYSLQYQHNALSGLLSGNIKTLNEEQSKVLNKYGQVVTRDCLKQMRQSLQILEMEEQKKLLQYQIKSKTFATSQIITFLEKRENAQVQRVSYEYLLNNKENHNMVGNQKMIQKVYVEKKLELNRVKDLIREQVKKEKKTAARAIWLACSQMMRYQQKKQIQWTFQNLFLPKRTPLRKLL